MHALLLWGLWWLGKCKAKDILAIYGMIGYGSVEGGMALILVLYILLKRFSQLVTASIYPPGLLNNHLIMYAVIYSMEPHHILLSFVLFSLSFLGGCFNFSGG